MLNCLVDFQWLRYPCLGPVAGRMRGSRTTVASSDSQIAATALRHKLTLIARNEKHFLESAVRILNPFSTAPT